MIELFTAFTAGRRPFTSPGRRHVENGPPARGPFGYCNSAQQWVVARSPAGPEDLAALLAAVRLQLAKKEQVWVYGRDKVELPHRKRLLFAAAVAAVAITTQAVFQDSLFRTNSRLATP